MESALRCALAESKELLDAGGHNTPDLDRLAVLGHDVRERRVGGFELDPAGAHVEVFDREIPIDHGHHDVAAAGLEGSVHHDDVVVPEACVHHGQPAHPQQVGRLRVSDQLSHQVDPRLTKISGRRRKPSTDGRSRQWQQQAARLGADYY